MVKITVFTPTYNRASTLQRVFDSLCNQTFLDFEWIIVDDGSTDKTETIVKDIKRKPHNFNIRYYYQTNQGKHVATNFAVKKADGEFFVTIDSDDACKPEAFEVLLKTWENIEKKENYKGVSCRCCTIENPEELIGTPFKVGNTDYYDSTDNEIRIVDRIKGELWGMTRTSIMRDIPYPEIENLHFFPESVYWGGVGEKYLTRYINIPLRYYFYDEKDNVTKKINPNEMIYQREYVIRNLLTKHYFIKNPWYFIKQSIGLTRDSVLLGKRFFEIISVSKNIYVRCLITVVYPLGFLLAKRYMKS